MPFADPEARRAWWHERRRQIREIIVEAKRCPCADCGISYPSFVMQFDHVRDEKLVELGSATRMATNLAMLREEIAKCEVVCANCHAYRTEARNKERRQLVTQRGC